MVSLSSKSTTIDAKNWHALEIPTLLGLMETDPEKGLNGEQVRERAEKFGPNALKGKPPQPIWLRFLQQFNQPLLYILIGAGAVKALMGEFVNAGVIWGVTTTNALIGFIQESKAEGAINALAASVETSATVTRNRQKIRIPSAELVPGDLVYLTSGDKVPADLRLIKVRDLRIDESGLTGESQAVEKSIAAVAENTGVGDRSNMAFAGGFVTFGQGSGVVVATGGNTETGKISGLIDSHTSLSTPLTRKFDKFSKKWLYIVLTLATITFIAGWRFKGLSAALESAVALTVSAIPEGLPAVITVTLAIGVNRMARRHAILRKLPAVETLGSTTVICSDKTGTLTENQMTVQSIWAGGKTYPVTGTGYDSNGHIFDGEAPVDLERHPVLESCLTAGVLCNDSGLEYKEGQWTVNGDATEGALIVSAGKTGLDGSYLGQLFPRQDSIPFESDYQYMATLHRVPEGKIIYVKGSAEAILLRCSVMFDVEGKLVTLDREAIEHRVKSMAAEGLRVLAFAQKSVPNSFLMLNHSDIESDLIFLGLQGMIDPPRPSAIAAVGACQNAGIEVKMITGDHAVTATAIAQRLGINHNGSVIAYTGTQLAAMDERELARAAAEGSVFARVAPEQKLRLVEALQSRGEIVAMTGDGVNDAPALKQADIGIAMGITGTEVAKEAADMLLTDDNFASIQAAVEEGRAVYRNLIKAICFILPVNGGESMTILFSVLIGRELPILSLQILWLNIINSITMTVPLAFEPKPGRIMDSPPRDPREPLLPRTRLLRILAISAFNWLVIFGVFEYIHTTTGNIDLARTMAINSLIAGRIFYLLSISQLIPNLRAGARGEKMKVPAIAYGIIGAIILQIAFAHLPLINQFFYTAPLSLSQWFFCLAVGSPMIFWSAFVNRFDPLD